MILDLKDGKLLESGKQEEGKTFHILHVMGMNDEQWDKCFLLGVLAGEGPENYVPTGKSSNNTGSNNTDSK